MRSFGVQGRAPWVTSSFMTTMSPALGCDVDHAFGDVVAVFDQAVLKEVPGAIKHAFVRAGDDEETPVAWMNVGEVGEADGVVAEDASVADFVADGVPAEIVAGAVQAECFVVLIGDVDLKRAAGEARPAIGEFCDDGPDCGVHGQAFPVLCRMQSRAGGVLPSLPKPSGNFASGVVT